MPGVRRMQNYRKRDSFHKTCLLCLGRSLTSATKDLIWGLFFFHACEGEKSNYVARVQSKKMIYLQRKAYRTSFVTLKISPFPGHTIENVLIFVGFFIILMMARQIST